MVLRRCGPASCSGSQQRRAACRHQHAVRRHGDAAHREAQADVLAESSLKAKEHPAKRPSFSGSAVVLAFCAINDPVSIVAE